MHSQSDNIEIMMNDEPDEVIEELFETLKKRYQNKFEEPMKGSDCNWTRTHNHLVRKQTLNHLAKLTKRVCDMTRTSSSKVVSLSSIIFIYCITKTMK